MGLYCYLYLLVVLKKPVGPGQIHLGKVGQIGTLWAIDLPGK